MNNKKIFVMIKSENDYLFNLPFFYIPKYEFDIKKFIETHYFSFQQRDIVEQDIDKKQIIPYIIIKDSQNRFFIYKRKGNEKRLHGFYSSGTGGHIDYEDIKENLMKEAPCDSKCFKINLSNFYEIIKKTLIRELYEETGIKINDRDFEKKIEFMGIIDEEISSVGKVHVGFVYLYKLSKDEIIKPVDEEIDYYQFLRIDEIYDIWNAFEKWSILAFSLLNITKTIIYISDKKLTDHKKINFFDKYGFTEFVELIIEKNNTDYFESFLNFILFEKQSKKFWYYLEEEDKFYKFKTLAEKSGLIRIKNES